MTIEPIGHLHFFLILLFGRLGQLLKTAGRKHTITTVTCDLSSFHYSWNMGALEVEDEDKRTGLVNNQ
ncbi:hypothetical protein DERF_007438 [Dermatophagoides farinae]|uniref:Uncharacterized protein n=1 Tax=Dermatophagoides farinae TaxID=6954 RepID=A0A922L3M6_DERFA|nr:hypothetical protein DERF_007438 [Dermatophagoides farinae]